MERSKFTQKQRGQLYADAIAVILDNPDGGHAVCVILGDLSGRLPYGVPYSDWVENHFPEFAAQEVDRTGHESCFWWPACCWTGGNDMRVEALLNAINLLP